jgi:hypothetical protein
MPTHSYGLSNVLECCNGRLSSSRFQPKRETHAAERDDVSVLEIRVLARHTVYLHRIWFRAHRRQIVNLEATIAACDEARVMPADPHIPHLNIVLAMTPDHDFGPHNPDTSRLTFEFEDRKAAATRGTIRRRHPGYAAGWSGA